VSDSECEHTDFEASVVVVRITDHDPMRFVAEVRVNCAVCGQRFGFFGIPKRISSELPGVSATRLEATLPIEPVDPQVELAGGCSVMVDPL
jgi:hypothetical protein